MEKKTRSSRKVPAASGSAGNSGYNSRVGEPRHESRARRGRTVVNATDPRTPVQRRGYDEPAYLTREDQTPSGSPHFTLPSIPSMPALPRDDMQHRPGRGVFDRLAHPRGRQQSSWDEYASQGEEWSAYPEDDNDMTLSGRSRAHSVARPLALMRADTVVERDEAQYQSSMPNARALVTTDSVPDLVAWRPPVPAGRKPVYTRAIETAKRNPWSVSRIMLTTIVVFVTLLLSVTKVGEPSQPLMQFFNAQAAGASSQNIAALVQPLTQGKRVDQYDSVAQYNEYWGAACSAAVLAETLTAWGVKGATIGRMIDELGSYISPYGGLLSYAGFQQVAAKHGMRSDFRENLSYKQMLYITNTLHLPLIVNVRISYGFYHFFSGGHFMVMTAGDSQGIRLVDSSLYYVKYMPLSVFNSMFTGRTVLLLPSDYELTLPSA